MLAWARPALGLMRGGVGLGSETVVLGAELARGSHVGGWELGKGRARGRALACAGLGCCSGPLCAGTCAGFSLCPLSHAEGPVCVWLDRGFGSLPVSSGTSRSLGLEAKASSASCRGRGCGLGWGPCTPPPQGSLSGS